MNNPFNQQYNSSNEGITIQFVEGSSSQQSMNSRTTTPTKNKKRANRTQKSPTSPIPSPSIPFSKVFNVFTPNSMSQDCYSNLCVKFYGSNKIESRHMLEITKPMKSGTWTLTPMNNLSGFWFHPSNIFAMNEVSCSVGRNWDLLNEFKLELVFNKDQIGKNQGNRHFVVAFQLNDSNRRGVACFVLVFEVQYQRSRKYLILEDTIALVRFQKALNYTENNMVLALQNQKQNGTMSVDLCIAHLTKKYGPIYQEKEDAHNHLRFTSNYVSPISSIFIYFAFGEGVNPEEALKTNYGQMANGEICVDFLTPDPPSILVQQMKKANKSEIVATVFLALFHNSKSILSQQNPNYLYKGNGLLVNHDNSNNVISTLSEFDESFLGGTDNQMPSGSNSASSPSFSFSSCGNFMNDVLKLSSIEDIISNREAMITISQEYGSRRDIFGYRLLDHVLIRGCVDWAKILINETNDSVNGFDILGTSTLEWCVHYKSFEVIREFFLKENTELSENQLSNPTILTENILEEYRKDSLIAITGSQSAFSQVKFKFVKNSAGFIRMWFPSFETLCQYLSKRFVQNQFRGNFISVAILHLSKPNLFVLEYIKKKESETIQSNTSQEIQQQENNLSSDFKTFKKHAKKNIPKYFTLNSNESSSESFETTRQLDFESLYENGDYEKVFKFLRYNKKLKLERDISNCPEYMALVTICKLMNIPLKKKEYAARKISNSFKRFIHQFGGYFNSMDQKDQQTIENCYKCFELCRNTRIANTLNFLKDRKIYLNSGNDLEYIQLETFFRLAEKNGPFFYPTKKDESESRNYLSVAVIFGRLDIVKYLLNNFNASVYETATQNQYSLLHYATYYGNYPIANYLKVEKQVISLNKNKKEENEFQSLMQGAIDRRRKWGNLMDNSEFEKDLRGFYSLYAGFFSLFSKYWPPISKTNRMGEFSSLSDVIISTQH